MIEKSLSPVHPDNAVESPDAEVEEYRASILNDHSKDKHLQAEEWRYCKNNFVHWCRTWIYIVDKVTLERKLFDFNPTQRKYYANRSQFDIILKARKVGISTYKLIQGLHTFNFFPDREALMITHRNELNSELFDRLHLAFRLQPEFLRPTLIRHRQGAQLVANSFPENCEMDGATSGSKYQVMSAEGNEPGQGFHLSFLHCSEYASFKHPESIRANAFGACAPQADIAIESTAQGFNQFRDEYLAAKEGTTRFRAHFFPWTEDPTCVAVPRKPDRWNQHVRDVVESLGLSAEQGQFYQDELGKLQDIDILKQEWPVNDVEAFLSTGRSYFDMDLLNRMIDVCSRQTPKRVEPA